MRLRPFQIEALKTVVRSWDAGKKSILLNMPAGTGKTMLSLSIFQTMQKDEFLSPLAHISSRKSLQLQFKDRLRDSAPGISVDTFTYYGLANLINKGKVNKDDYKVLIFDDVDFVTKSKLRAIFEYFNGFKIGFATNTSKEISEIFKVDIDGITFGYLNEAISDGSFFATQKNDYRQFFNNIHSKIDNIKIGTNWTNTIKRDLIENIEIAKDQNEGYQRVFRLLFSGEILATEIIELSNRKGQLGEFNKLLIDRDYFDAQAKAVSGTERVWQEFFENNQWIFGFGLNYIFNSPLEGKTLEQTIEGYSIKGHGKMADALMETTGLVQSLCFGEIKTHRSPILKNVKSPYRPESWAISDELAGGIAQAHRTVQKSLYNIRTALSVYDENGYKQKDQVFQYKPKSFLIIGSLSEFRNEKGDIHEDKFSSFELFRRSISDLEIITFDELYERANAMITKKWNRPSRSK